MATVDQIVGVEDWTQISSGHERALVQLKGQGGLRVAVASAAPEDDVSGFVLAFGDFHAIDIAIPPGEEVFVRAINEPAPIVYLMT